MSLEIFQCYSDILEACKATGPYTLSVAAAEDEAVLEAVQMAEAIGLADAILVGDAVKIRPLAQAVGLERIRIVDEPDETVAAARAVSLVREGQADVLMKGHLNTSTFMRAVLSSDQGLKSGALLSHLAAFEIPGQKKLIFVTDGGLNINPGLSEKKAILVNAIEALRRMGLEEPKVAILTANEQVNPKMPSTVEAQALVEMRRNGDIEAGLLEGPIALDVAMTPLAAASKGISSRISGDVDLFLMPNIETGNVFGKSLIYFAHAKMSGLILGAACPIVLTSRAESAEGKLNSLALACLITGRGSAQASAGWPSRLLMNCCARRPEMLPCHMPQR